MRSGSLLTVDYVRTRYDANLIPLSFTVLASGALWLTRVGLEKHLCILARGDSTFLDRFGGAVEAAGQDFLLMRVPKSPPNAAALRLLAPYLRPRPLGLAKSAGFGDRLGIASFGHARAICDLSPSPEEPCIAPIFAQQSVRENSRTHRTPQEVLDDATWGCFEAGWKAPVGADADHLKTREDVEAFAASGYSLFTIDPGAYVVPSADALARTRLEAEFRALPWDSLETTKQDLLRRYPALPIRLETGKLDVGRLEISRAAVKYGRCIAHVASLVRSIASKAIPYEIEISVDETDSPTSPLEHYFIASELKRLGVTWVGLAPRLPGLLEKGIDYIGDLGTLRQALVLHGEIARALGPYKLSLHSGSDKFSVYPILEDATRGLMHLKTAGTSYLEALRVVAATSPPLFRQVCRCAVEAYGTDRASYHVSADASCLQEIGAMADEDLPSLLDRDGPREVLHVTFGSILDRFRPQLLKVLGENEDTYASALRRHFRRHLLPFVSSLPQTNASH